MAITIDSSTPAAVGGGSGTSTTVTSNSFSPPANSLIVVCNQYGSNGSHVTGITDTAGHTYTKLVSSATTSAYADVWVADVGSTAPGSITLTATYSSSNSNASMGLEVLVLNGAAPVASQTGQTATATATTGGPSATLSSAASSSWILGSVALKSNTAPTIPGGQTDVWNSLTQLWSSSTKSGFVQGNTAPGNTNLTINDTAPSTTWSISVVEIVAGAGGGSVTGSASLSAALSLTDSATVAHTGQATESAALSLTASANVAHIGQGSLAATVSMSASGKVAHTASASLAGALTLTDSATVTHTGRADLSAVLTLNASAGGGAVQGQASLTGSVSMTSSASVNHTGQASASVQLTLDASGLVTINGQAQLAATATLTASGSVAPGGRATLHATATMSAGAVVAHTGAADLRAVLTLTAVAQSRGPSAPPTTVVNYYGMGFLAGQYDIYALLGERLTIDFDLYTDSSQTQPLDLTGYLVEIELTPPAVNPITLTLTDGNGLSLDETGGVVTLEQDTSSWQVGRGKWSMKLTDSAGRPYYPVRGLIFTGKP